MAGELRVPAVGGGHLQLLVSAPRPRRWQDARCAVPDRDHIRLVAARELTDRSSIARDQTRPAVLLERDRELGAIDTALGSVHDGGAVIYLEGAAGLGKSGLVGAARERAAREDLLVLSAGGHELEQGFPFGLARQLFAPHLPSDRAARQRLFAGTAASAGRLLDGDRDVASEDPAGIGLIQGLLVLLERLIDGRGHQGALLAVDDAQWSDSASLRFLVGVSERLSELPVVIVVAAREPERSSELLARLAGGPRARVLRLSPLGTQAIAELARLVCGQVPELRFVQACAETSGGNPFLLVELLAELVSAGVAPVDAEAARVAQILPQSVLRSVLARVAGLSGGARSLADAVAILGDGTPLRRAAALAELDAREAEAAADQLARVGILRGGEPVAVVHALVGSALLAELPEFGRRHARRRAAELLSAEGATIEEVCAQLLDSRAESDPWVVERLRAGARAAMEQAEPPAAVALLRRALEEPPEDGRRAAVLIELAHAEAASGDPGASVRLGQALQRLDDVRDRARALYDLSRILFARGEFAAAAEAAERGLSELTEDGRSAEDPLAEDLLGLLLIAAGFNAEMVESALRRIFPLMQEVAAGRPPRHPAVSAVLASQLAMTGTPAAEVRAVVQPALAPDALRGDIYGAALTLVGVALLAADELELLVDVSESAAAAASERGSVIAGAIATQWKCCAQCLMGELEEAASCGQPALELARGGWKGMLGWTTFYVARAYIALGRLELAEAMIAGGLEITEHPNGFAVMYEARGRLALASGEYEAALADFLKSAEHLNPAYMIPSVFGWRPLAAIAAHALGDTDRAEAWIAEELELVSDRYVPRVRATVLRAGGIVRGGEDGVTMLEESVALLERSSAALELAYSRLELGAALRRLGRRVQAREQLREGLELALSFGAAPLAQRAREELAASGARLRRDSSRGPGGLTPSERRVAELAATGLSVPDIARRLVLSPKTVEWHLGHVYQKLQVHSRAEFYARWQTAD